MIDIMVRGICLHPLHRALMLILWSRRKSGYNRIRSPEVADFPVDERRIEVGQVIKRVSN
jgi:hypothetical protein